MSTPSRNAPRSPPAVTPIAFVHAILLGFRKYGVAPDRALELARIRPEDLADPGGRITADQFEVLSSAAMQGLDDEALGWFSRPLPWGSYGLLCRGSFTAPTLEVALKRWCRHHRLLTTDVSLQLACEGELARLSIETHRPLGPLEEFCLVSLLRFVLGFACWAVDSRISLRVASFPFAAPPHADLYPLLFGGRIDFDADSAGVVFDARYLGLPLLRDEAALRLMLQRALPLTVLQYRRDRILARRVELLYRQSPELLCSAEVVARQLNLSIRTLHRHLHEEGTSLQQLKDHCRREHAQELLRRSVRPIKQIAQAVGFRSEKSFARAFELWTGDTPGAYRRHGKVVP